MGKIKIKDIEGDADAIHALFHKNSCDLPSYIGAQKAAPKQSVAYAIACIILFLVVAGLVWINAVPPPAGKILVLALFALSFVITFFAHIIYKSNIVTVIALAGALVITLLALEIYTPQQMAKKLEETARSHYSK